MRGHADHFNSGTQKLISHDIKERAAEICEYKLPSQKKRIKTLRKMQMLLAL